jgi:hypothetical protein
LFWTNPKFAAVLTGDVVNSRRLPRDRREALPRLLKEAGRAARKAFPRIIPFELQVFRGDSWQLVVEPPAQALRVALFLRCHVIAASPPGALQDMRIAIGVDQVDFVPDHAVSEGDGAAYRASGAALDGLKQARLALVGPGLPRGLSVCVTLLDALIQKWTARQALAVQHKLLGQTQSEIAKAWPERSTQQAVADQLARARWSAVAEALQFAEEETNPL